MNDIQIIERLSIYKWCNAWVIPMKQQVNITLENQTLNEVKRIAESEGLPYTIMLRNWVIRRAREYTGSVPISQKEALD